VKKNELSIQNIKEKYDLNKHRKTKKVKQKIEEISSDIFFSDENMTAIDFFKYIESIAKKYQKKYNNDNFFIVREYSSDGSDYIGIYQIIEKEEIDIEVARRLLHQEKQKQKEIENQRKEIENAKKILKKYGEI